MSVTRARAMIEPVAEGRGVVGTPGERALHRVSALAGPVGTGIGVAAVCLAGLATVQVAHAVPGYSLVDDPVAGAVVTLSVGWLTCVLGAVAWQRRPADRTGPLLVGAGVSWLMAQWATPGSATVFGAFAAPAFTAGLVLTGATPLLVAHLALAYPGGRLRSWSRRALVVAGFIALVAVLGVGGSMFFDPLGQGCACPSNWLLVANEPGLSLAVSRLGLGLGAGWALLTAGYLTRALVVARPAARTIALPVLAPALVGLLLTAVSLAAGTDRGYQGTSGGWANLRLAQAGTLVTVAAGVGWGLLRTRRVQAALARSAIRQVDTPGRQLRADLADLLGDPDLLIAHRLDNGSVVDSEARPVDLTATGRVVTELPLAGSGVLLVHRAGLLDSPLLRESLASAAGLALTNDRLRARTLAQVAELQASQVRIVRAGDAERRRLERDLHDGAQQRLVGIMLGLRLLRAGRDTAPGLLQQVETEVGQAIDDLRALSHGLFPMVLSDEGLAAALHALAETHRLTVGQVPTVRFPAELETTAYLVVARAASTGAASVDVSQQARRLIVRIRVHGRFVDRGLSDRVAALAGTLTVEQHNDGDHLTLVLPTSATDGNTHASREARTRPPAERP